MDNNVAGVGRAGIAEINPALEAQRRGAAGASFEVLLKQQLEKNSPLQFSKHAKERISQRGIEISDTLLGSIKEAVAKARDKGARDVVIIDSKGAFIVNVPNNTVVTTISGPELKDSIFTNIDSAVII